jgi:hypothetical protein
VGFLAMPRTRAVRIEMITMTVRISIRVKLPRLLMAFLSSQWLA